MKHFIELKKYTVQQLNDLFELSIDLKQKIRQGVCDKSLKGKIMVMVFEKPSSRTRLSFQVAMLQLGGEAIYMRPEDIGGPLGEREPIKDLTRVLNGYVDVIVARTFKHDAVLELAQYSTVPVINALTDLAHPCQAMADMLTIHEHLGELSGKTLAYIGDGNNVAISLAVACRRFGLNFVIAAPPAYALPDEFVRQVAASEGTGTITCLNDPVQAVRNADVIYTDTWTSMGQEKEKQQRINDFKGFQINADLVAKAPAHAKIMHCLPAYRGLEITDDVIESANSVIFDQAENRLHFQRALLKYLFQ